MKSHFTCAELAAMKLPGCSTSRQGWEDKVKREGWAYKEEKSRGRGGIKRMYQPTKEVMTLVRENLLGVAIASVDQEVIQATETLPAVNITAPAALKDWQRQTAEARAAICAEVKRLAAVSGTDRAILKMVEMASKGTLPEHMQQLVALANARSGKQGKRTLSRRSIYRWLNDSENGISALAPKSTEKMAIASWATPLLNLYLAPQKPTLSFCIEQLPKHLPAGDPVPTYSAAQRLIKKMSRVDAQRGRMGNRELKNIRPFIRRDTSQMWPGDAYTADGHTFDAEVAHPRHGKPFRPELTTVLDIATRRAVGWSASLAESTWSVLDALRNACEIGGIPAIFYVDNGSGFKNAAMSKEATGFMARLHITLTHSLPYNSQARGIEERSHQSIWVKGAKTLPTYMGAKMDQEAKQKVFKITRQDIRISGTSRLLIGWNDFIIWCQQQIDAYNNRPHRGLPKIWDEAEGKKRHQTPNEAWAAAMSEGWEPVALEQDEADDLFRPQQEAITRRGEITLFTNQYFHPALEHYHGETMRVGYDIHDASRVWVRDQEGRLVCVAHFEANKRSYFPQSFISQAAEKRAQGRIKRAEEKIIEAEQELQPQQLIEQQPVFEMPRMAIDTPREEARLEEKPSVEHGKTSGAKVVDLPGRPVRPMFDTSADKYRWLLEHQKEITPEDEAWLDYYRLTAEWGDLFGDKEVATR